jgi:hypothetical protein
VAAGLIPTAAQYRDRPRMPARCPGPSQHCWRAEMIVNPTAAEDFRVRA